MSFEGDQPTRDLDRDVPDALVDAFFDRELSPEAQRQVLRAVRHDAHTRDELERTAEALASLRDQPLAPDMTRQILARADSRRRFLPRRLRRITRTARLGVSGAALLVLLGVATAQRAWPDALSLTPHDTPLADVNTAFQADAIQSAAALRAGVDRARVSLASFPQRAHPQRAHPVGFVSVEHIGIFDARSQRACPSGAMVSLNAPPAPPDSSERSARRAFSVTTLVRFEVREPGARLTRYLSPGAPESQGEEPSETLLGVLP